MAALSTDLDRDDAVPYFLWDQPITVAELRRRLAMASPPERARLLGKILREARSRTRAHWTFTGVGPGARDAQGCRPHTCQNAAWTAVRVAWVLSEIEIGDDAEVPGGVSPAELRAFIADLQARLARLAFPRRGTQDPK